LKPPPDTPIQPHDEHHGDRDSDRHGSPPHRLLDALTLEEQVLLLAGANFWMTVPIERLGIPALKVTDGPNGARGGGSLIGGVKAACFPVGIALASTWNTELVERIGLALADEAHSKGARVLLAPTVNIHVRL
jgi:beta-glucosidase